MLTAREISVRYGEREVLRNVSLQLSAGRITALLGPNGAGKSTLLRALNGAVPTAGGKVLLNGSPVSEHPRREVARRIAVVAQENETKFPITVLEFVLAGRFAHGRAFGWETAEDLRSAEEALRQCDLSSFSDRLMNELSGGERQRVVLARALATGAEILLLDEPTANLDLAHQALMFRRIRERCRDSKASAVIITHDLNLASEFADEVLLLSEGEVLAAGTPRTVMTERNLREVFGVSVLLDENPATGNVRVTTIY